MPSFDELSFIPKAIEPYCAMEIANSRILIYAGSFSLIQGEETVTLTGEISYTFQHEYHIEFHGTGSTTLSIWTQLDSPTVISTPNGLKGECIINMIKARNGNCFYGGQIQYLFSEQKKCTTWHWSYINMQSFIGAKIQHDNLCSRSVGADRLSFLCNDGTRIIIENINSTNKDIHPIRITHRCKLLPAKGKPLSHKEVEKYLNAFTHFISFVVGRYHSPILVCGQDKHGQLSFYHRVYYDKSRIGVNSWLPFPHDQEIESLWPTFESIWNGKDEDKADILSTAVHWYLEANIGSGKMEGAYIMAITGIEMLWNVILEKKEQTAKEKLQNLLKKMNYCPAFDAGSLINTRNQLTHYDSKNRQKYQKLTQEQKLQCLENALNVLELAILYWLGYQGHYADRLCENKWRGSSTKKVPWAGTIGDELLNGQNDN